MYLTFRDVNADNTLLQDSHVTTAITSWMRVRVQNLLSVVTHCGTEYKYAFNIGRMKQCANKTNHLTA